MAWGDPDTLYGAGVLAAVGLPIRTPEGELRAGARRRRRSR